MFHETTKVSRIYSYVESATAARHTPSIQATQTIKPASHPASTTYPPSLNHQPPSMHCMLAARTTQPHTSVSQLDLCQQTHDPASAIISSIHAAQTMGSISPVSQPTYFFLLCPNTRTLRDQPAQPRALLLLALLLALPLLSSAAHTITEAAHGQQQAGQLW